jgi:hypothetical protein
LADKLGIRLFLLTLVCVVSAEIMHLR